MLFQPATVYAHPKGTLTVTPNQASPGDTLLVRGAGLAPTLAFRIELRGALRTFPLGRFRADSAGRLEMRMAVPAEASAGAYVVAAVAADGDVSAQADLTVNAPGKGPPGGIGASMHMPGMQGMSGMGNMPGMPNMPAATAEHMKLDVTTSAAEWVVIGIVVALSALIGLYLLRPPADAG